MAFHFRYVEGVPSILKNEIQHFGSWLRSGYEFPVPLEIKLINRPVLIDFDSTECHLRWWQLDNESGSIKVQIAVGKFTENFDSEGAEVACPTVIAAIGRGLSYYYQAIDDYPDSEQIAADWGDSLLDAYCDGKPTPHPTAWRLAENKDT
ncbi:MAG: hypothetical protein ACI9VS_003184 [Candidatus Binatia bacterium]|jgi:hypothetical protein